MMFTVIIPTYNRKESLLELLDALTHQSCSPDEFDVIVVDDGSTDGTPAAVREQSYPFRLHILSQENGGPGSARNKGAAVAQGDFLAFTEDDVEPDHLWLERAGAWLRADPTIDVLEGRTISADDRTNIRRFDRAGIPSFIPCNLFVRRSDFIRSSGYDPAFYDLATHRYFREDADLGFRLLDMGTRIELAEDVVVAHPRQFTRIRDAFRHARRYVFDPLLYRKHPVRYREMIERKVVAGIPIRRVHHVVALTYLLALAGLGVAIGMCETIAMVGTGALALGGVLFYKFKYEGEGGFLTARVVNLPCYAVVPLVYLGSIVAGCLRFRTIGPLIP